MKNDIDLGMLKRQCGVESDPPLPVLHHNSHGVFFSVEVKIAYMQWGLNYDILKFLAWSQLWEVIQICEFEVSSMY